MNASVVPDRNVILGALSAIAVYVLTTIAGQHGWEIPADIQVSITLIVGFGLAHLIPLSAPEVAAKTTNETVKIAQADPNNPTDLAKVIDDKIVHAAQMDPQSDVSYVVPPVPVPPGEPATIVPPLPKTL